MIPRVLSIAGSDSGGGAGIQADLKTFSSLGVYGMTVITAVTSQNTYEVKSIQAIDPNIVADQIDAVFEDIGVDVVKTGMLFSKEIIEVVAEKMRKYKVPLVVDPVMVAKSGAKLLKEEAIVTLKRELIPLATIITPNALEASYLAEMKISNLKEAIEGAKKIASLGSKAVLVKGGHLKEEKAVDILYYNNNLSLLESDRLETKPVHGTGCSYASAIACYLAKGEDIYNAVKKAKDFIFTAIKYKWNLGKGSKPVNPLAHLYNEVEKYKVLEELKRAVKILEENNEVSKLIPESQSNLVMALPYASSLDDVAGILGRIVKVGNKVKASSCPSFGASKHVASTVLVAMQYDPKIRAAMNIKYSEEILKVLESMNLTISSYDRKMEPEEIKGKEGLTIPWGTKEAIKKVNKVPDVIYHKGDFGKEPMITLLGKSALEVAQICIELAKRL